MLIVCPRCSHVAEHADMPSSSCPHCGHTWAAALGATVGTDPNLTSAYDATSEAGAPGSIGGYRLLRRVGAGGMGAVYEAEHLATGRRVALKLILQDVARSPEAVDRFRREGRLASAVTHPRCVFVLTADEQAGQPYIAMELMPGETLKDLVAQKGPLPPEEAVARVLDLVEGLQELHRRGIIHRDVKPANCFLDADGRVKVGDFGLALSLLAGADPAEQGRFLGTPLFASPEQLKGEPLDARTDVYSASATLYYLLTGRAPFQNGGASRVFARATTEAPPPMRDRRPELPRALDGVVLRGLERDPRRRWQDLEQLRRALVGFVPLPPSAAGMGLRLAAYLIDYVVLLVLWVLASEALKPWGLKLPVTSSRPDEFLLANLPEMAYFILLEGLVGWSLGKWLLGLRVYRTGVLRRAGLARAALRTLVFYALFYLPFLLIEVLPLDCFTKFVLYVLNSLKLGGIPLVMLTMRERNGYRGLHEFLSGTRVVRLTRPGKAPRSGWLRGRASPDLLAEHRPHPEGAPAAVGPFRVVGALRWAEGDGVLVGEDPALGRKVLLWLRPDTTPPLTDGQRNVARPTRPRWLAEGTQGEARWDAFVALGGCPLPDLVRGGRPLSWGETRPVLRQLADELAGACADGSLPRTLRPEQVWVQPAGGVLLMESAPTAPPGTEPAPPEPDERRALDFLARVAVLCLEGRPRPDHVGPGPVLMPLPLHASQMLRRLAAGPQGYARVADFCADLAASHHRPASVTRARRFVHLLAQGGLLFAAGVLMYVTSSLLGNVIGSDKQYEAARVLIAAAVVLVVSLGWAGLARGGASFQLCGLALVRRDGRRAARWQAAWRSLQVWGQGIGVFVAVAAAWLALFPPANQDKAETAIVWSGLIGLVSYGLLAGWLPRRALHDRLAGTYLVPK
jgi:hypothetical protein